MRDYFKCLILAILTLKELSSAIRLTEVRVPNYTVKDNHVRLECHFNLESEILYSVKWYKDGNEFYRFLPRDFPPAQVFVLPGVSVDLHNSTDHQVVLQSVNLSSSGRYRCEVSGEAPSFQTVTDHGDMTVVVLPEEDPKISNGKSRYQIGEFVHVNCTSGRSKPAVKLSWFINGEPADYHYLTKYKAHVTGREGLEQSTLGLRFKVKQKHFHLGDMKLKCLAVIESVYWKSNEESVVGDKQKASILESKKPISSTSTTNTRADRVHANNGNSLRTSLINIVTASLATILLMKISQRIICR